MKKWIIIGCVLVAATLYFSSFKSDGESSGIGKADL